MLETFLAYVVISTIRCNSVLFIYLNSAVDGNEVGSIQSKLLCRSLLDLYMGEDPFDRKAKEDIELNLATLLQK